jgi:oligopeptide/dipeptide ABC transporter ATP-binding protein
MVGLLKPDEGFVDFEGVRLNSLKASELRALRQNIQIIFQDPFATLNPRLTIEQTLIEPLKNFGLHKGEELKRVAELLEMVGLSKDYLNRYPHEFSGGQRQRIGIARAISVEPKLIICDEVVSALDVSIQAQILNLLQDLQKRLGLTYVFISHDLSVVHHIADKVVVMYKGKVVESSDKQELFHRPRHPYTQVLLSSLPGTQNSLVHDTLGGEVAASASLASCAFADRCMFAVDICRKQEPKLEIYQHPTHLVSCHKKDNLPDFDTSYLDAPAHSLESIRLQSFQSYFA